MEDKAGAMTGQGRARVIAGQRRIGHRMSRGHVRGQGTRQRAGPELSPGRHQNRANKSQCGVMPREGWRAEQVRQSGRQRKTIGVAGITAGQGNGVADDMMEGRATAGRRVRQRVVECGW